MKTHHAEVGTLGGIALATVLAGCEASRTLSLLPDPDRAGAGNTASAGSSAVPVEPPDAGQPGQTDGAAATGGASGLEGGTAGTGTGTGGLLVGGLLHRYTFSGTGTTLVDSVGTAHGTIMGGAELDGSGSLVLDGVDDYIALPPGLVSSLTSATIVTWFTWHSSRPWERVFDFGSYVLNLEGLRESTSHFFFTPLRSDGTGTGPGPSANLWNGRGLMQGADSDNLFPADVEQMIAVVFDGTMRSLDAIIGESPVGSVTNVPLGLSEIQDENCWLGQSQSYQDPNMLGTYNEFRIYGVVLVNADVRNLFRAGPDAP